MRKTLLSMATVALMAFGAQAQFKIMPKAGFVLAKTALQENENVKFNTGFALGAAFEIPAGDIVSIQPELLYMQKGTKFEIGPLSSKTKLNYLEIPILVKAMFGEEDKLRPFVYIGPYFGYALSGKVEDEKIEFDSDVNNRLDIGAYVGAGVSLPVGSGAVSLEGRYGYGFTNFAKDEDLSKDELKSQSRVIGIFLGYAIPLGGD